MPTDYLPQQKSRTTTGRRTSRKKKPKFPWAQTAMLLFLCAGVISGVVLALGSNMPARVSASPPPPSPTHSVGQNMSTIVKTPAPTPTPTPTPIPYDFFLPAPESAPVEDNWFEDAVFVGDSRTDGMRLFGGIPNTSYIQHTGITVFEVSKRKVIKISGKKYTVLEALALEQYSKVFLMLGVNELGYGNDEGFKAAYAGLVDSIRAIQPNAVLYLQNLPPINPEKAKENNIPYYVTNEKISQYNTIIAQVAEEKKAVLVDVATALSDENGILPQEGTGDGVHFSKDYYGKWHTYLNCHTVDPDLYWAGQSTK